MSEADKQFEIPKGFVAWCHLCNQGFKTIDEITKHDREKVNDHKRIFALRSSK